MSRLILDRIKRLHAIDRWHSDMRIAAREGKTTHVGVALYSLYGPNSLQMQVSGARNIHLGHFARFSMMPTPSQLNQVEIALKAFEKGRTSDGGSAMPSSMAPLPDKRSEDSADVVNTSKEELEYEENRLRSELPTNAYLLSKHVEEKLKIGMGAAKGERSGQKEDKLLNKFVRGGGKIILFRTKDIDAYRDRLASLKEDAGFRSGSKTKQTHSGLSERMDDMVKMSLRPFQEIKNGENVVAKVISFDRYVKLAIHWRDTATPLEKTLEKLQQQWEDAEKKREQAKIIREANEAKAIEDAMRQAEQSMATTTKSTGMGIWGIDPLATASILSISGAEEAVRLATETGVMPAAAADHHGKDDDASATEAERKEPINPLLCRPPERGNSGTKNLMGPFTGKRKGDASRQGGGDGFQMSPGGKRLPPGYVCIKCSIPGHHVTECKVPSNIKRQRTAEADLLGIDSMVKAHRPKIHQMPKQINGFSPWEFREASEEDKANPDITKHFFAKDPSKILVKLSDVGMLEAARNISSGPTAGKVVPTWKLDLATVLAARHHSRY